jgi:PAS domain S-box-containing protein
MAKEVRSALLRYGSAVGLTALATVIRWGLNPVLNKTAPFALFVMAVTVAALYAGPGPALLTAFAGALIGLFVWLLPTHSLTEVDGTILISVTVYLILCIFLSILIELMRRARQRAEVNAAALNESRKLLSTTLGSIGDAVIATDTQGRVTFMNLVAESLTGWRRGEAIGKPTEEVFVIVNEQSRQPVESPIVRVLSEGFIVGLANHTVLIRKDGTETPIDDSGAPIKDDQGKLLGAVLVFRDITERRKAEDALRQSRERLDLTLEASGIGFWYCDLPFTELVWDVRSKAHFGLPADQTATLKTFYERLHADDRAHVRQAIERAIAEHILYDVDYRTVGLDGRLRWIHATGRTFHDNDGTPIRFAGITIDVTERKQAEEALAFLASIVESSEDAIIGKRLDGTILSWNNGAERLYGYRAEEVVGKDIRLLAVPGHNDIDDILVQLQSGKPIHDYETVRVKKNGERVEVALAISPIKGPAGALTGASTIARDISERKRAEQERERLMAEINNQRTRLNNIVANVPGVVWEAWGQPDAASQRIDYVSDYVESMLGYSVEEWLQTPNFWLTIVHPEDREPAAHTAAENFASGGGVNQFRWLTKDGRAIWVEARDVVIRDEQGQPVGMRGVTMDISERKRAEEERTHFLAEQQRLILAEQAAREAAEAGEQRARFLAEASAALASSLDYEATLRSVAQLAVPYLADWCAVHIAEDGQHLEQLAITHIDPAKVAWAEELGVRFPPDPTAPLGVPNVLRTGKSEYYPEIDDALLVKTARNEDHLHFLRHAGMKSAMIVPLTARNRTLGVITFVASESHPHYTAADLTLAEDLARRAALAVDNAVLFAEAHRARAEAEEANRLKDEFLATVSHELRTPLNAIVGWSHMLRTRSFDDATTTRALETIERNAKSQAQIVEDILDVSRIITGKLRLHVQPVDLAAIIDAALDSVRPAAEAKEIRLQTILDSRAGPVAGDANRLQQVVWNLLANAVKFTPKNGHIQVRLEHVDSHVEIIVADTGQGIRADLLPFVFDRFRQGDSTSTRLHGGLGLGLAIVRHLVELHGGTVTAESDGEGHGATFTVKLPLMPLQAERYDTERAQPSVPTAPLSQEAPDLAGIRVLVVDDEPDTRDMLRTMIEQLGGQVKLCASSGEALQVFHEWSPDVIVSDIEMPGEDGYQLMRQIRELAPERGGKTPAVALTAYARTDDRMRALSAGYQMHVAKPADPIELAAVIASLASQRHNRLN